MVHVFSTPTDPLYSSQWHHPRISSPVAWDTTTGTSQVRCPGASMGWRQPRASALT